MLAKHWREISGKNSRLLAFFIQNPGRTDNAKTIPNPAGSILTHAIIKAP
jgi:hypothetical protein